MENLFVYKFKTKKGLYVYDVNSNNFLLVNEKVFQDIDTPNWNRNPDILEGVKKGIVSSLRPQIVRPSVNYEEMKEYLDKKIQRLILFVADSCNLKCKYCCYSEVYSDSRLLSGKLMSWDIAKKAIDFYFSHTGESINKKEEKVISFYGGEPLLNFELIKKCLEYVKSVYKTKANEVDFAITTNLTLLNNEIMQFLTDNNIFIAISIDGPKELHDRYRVFKDGKGTFDIVMRNIKKLYEHNKEYFRKNVVFNVVTAPPIDFIKIYEFFSSNPILSENWYGVIGGLTYTGGPCFEEIFHIDRREGFETEEKIFEIFKENVIKYGYCNNNFLLKFYYEDFWNIYNRNMKRLPQEIVERSSCIPGQMRLLVDPDGKFYPCEKGASSLQIGDIIHGFDYEKCYSLIEEYCKIRNELCLNCYAIRFCKTCYIGALKGGKLDKKTKEEECKMIKVHYSNMLRRFIEIFIEIMEENPKAFEYSRKVLIPEKYFLL